MKALKTDLPTRSDSVLKRAELDPSRRRPGMDAPAASPIVEDPFDDEEDDDAEDETEAPEEEVDLSNAPDDALGVYLRQMGAIPLLNRKQELELAQKLERERQRFRRAALFNWLTLQRVVETFTRVLDGKLALDPTIDVVTSLNLSREKILARMPHNLRTLRQLIETSKDEFKALMRTRSATGTARVRRQLFRQLRKAIKLIEELSPRTELLEQLVLDLPCWVERMAEIEQRINFCGRSVADRQHQTQLTKELRDVTLEVQVPREDLEQLVDD